MLQSLREKTGGLIAKAVLGILIFVFSFFGINTYFNIQAETFVAKVGESEIQPEEFRKRFEEYREQMRGMMGAAYDGQYFEQPTVKRQVLDRLIEEEVLDQANKRLGVAIPAERLRKEIAGVAAFQVNGKFDANQYKMLLNGQQMNPAIFEERVRRDLAVRELPEQIAATVIVADADVDRFIALRDQTRDFRYIRLDAPTINADAAVEDAEIDKYFADHQDQFRSEETVTIEYLDLDASKLVAEVSPDETMLRSRYEEQKHRYVVAEQRLASHILVKVPANADAAAQKSASEKAADLAKQAREAKDFGALAKTSSDDLGSKSQGGDLGWLEKGMTEAAFENALFAMKAGDISEPILSPEGYHIIWMRELRAEHGRPFEDVRGELEKEFAEAERERIYSDMSGQLIDLIYQDPSSLEPAATELKLTIEKAGPFGRNGGGGIAANQAVAKAAFSESVLVDGNTSELVEIAPNHSVVIRVSEHTPAAVRKLEDVREQVVAAINSEKRAQQAKTQADALLARAEKGEGLDALATELKLTVVDAKQTGRNAANHDAALVSDVFKMTHPSAEKPLHKLVTLGSESYAVVELSAVTAADPSKADSATRDSVRQTLEQGLSSTETRAFIDSLRSSSVIEIAEDRM